MVWDYESVGQRVTRLREERKLSQKSLASKTGLSEQTINRIEKDATRILGEYADRLAEALQVSNEYLKDGDSHSERQTLKLIDEMRAELGITANERERLAIMACGAIKQRNNARLPLSKVELESLLAIIRST